jgi:hypothetical protein
MRTPFYNDMLSLLALLFFLGLLLYIFQSPLSEGFGNPQRCDVDSPCSGHLKCINGFCAETTPVGVKESSPVPLLPPGSPAPYFS